MTTMTANVSLIIPTVNRASILARFLASVNSQSLKPSQCIIIDQSDDDTTLVEVNRFNPIGFEIRYHKLTYKSLIDARNMGLSLTQNSEYICFLDDDLQLDPEFLRHLVYRMQSGNYAGGMGQISSAVYKRSLIKSLFMMPNAGDGRFLANGCPTFVHGLPYFKEVEFLSGGISIYKAEVIKSFLFDWRLGGTPYGYGDDVDVSLRISRKFKLFYEPLAKANDTPSAPGKDVGILFRRYWLQNMYYLMRKNIGLNIKSIAAFFWMCTGYIICDLIMLRRSALLGNFLGLYNILRGRLDSILEEPCSYHSKSL